MEGYPSRRHQGSVIPWVIGWNVVGTNGCKDLADVWPCGVNQFLCSGVHTLIWTAPRIENIPELLVIREQLARKYGVEFAHAAGDNAEMVVNQKVSQPCAGLRCGWLICDRFGEPSNSANTEQVDSVSVRMARYRPDWVKKEKPAPSSLCASTQIASTAEVTAFHAKLEIENKSGKVFWVAAWMSTWMNSETCEETEIPSKEGAQGFIYCAVRVARQEFAKRKSCMNRCRLSRSECQNQEGE